MDSNDPSKPAAADPADPSLDPKPIPSAAPKPTAAQIVVEGQKTERELVLERELKGAQVRINELEDERHKLKTITEPVRPSPDKQKRSWLDGWVPEL